MVGCPLLLQLWSYERFPIGRPYVYVEVPFGAEDLAGAYVPALGDLPTVGSVWTQREVLLYYVTIHSILSCHAKGLLMFICCHVQRQFAHTQVRGCYPSFTVQFDSLHEDQVIWEPYSDENISHRYPFGISYLCTRDRHYWMTKANVVFDMTVEEMALHRVMR